MVKLFNREILIVFNFEKVTKIIIELSRIQYILNIQIPLNCFISI